MSVFAPSVINLWKTFESFGLDPRPFFEAEDIQVKLPIDPGMRLPYEKIDRIRGRLAEETGEEALGLRSASVFSPSQFGALGYALQASLTIRNACERLERFVRVVSDRASFVVEDKWDNLELTFNFNEGSVCESVRDDGAMAMVTRMFKLIGGDKFRLQTVNFKRQKPIDMRPYFEYFACELNFDQPHNQLLIPLSLVDEVLEGANPELALMNDQVVTRRLALLDRNDIVARVQAALLDQLPSGTVSDESVAASLNMSVRTMHRKLASIDQNFRSLLVEMRRTLAEQYILDNSLTLTEISLLLGFSEPSSFSRAFKNWTGKAPSEARQAND